MEAVFSLLSDGKLSTFVHSLSNEPDIVNEGQETVMSFSVGSRIGAFMSIQPDVTRAALDRLVDAVPWNTKRLSRLIAAGLAGSAPLAIPDANGVLAPVIRRVILNELAVFVRDYLENAIRTEQHHLLRLNELLSFATNTLLPQLAALDVPADRLHGVLRDEYLRVISENMFAILTLSNSCDLVLDYIEMRGTGDDETMLNRLIRSITTGLFNSRHATEETIDRLVDMIPVLRQIDPTGFVVDQILQLARGHLRQRRDLSSAMLHVIVRRVLETGDGTLSLNDADMTSATGSLALDYDGRADAGTWRPDPQFVTEPISAAAKTACPVALAVSILPSASTLADEYQKYVAERLLKTPRHATIEQLVAEVETMKRSCRAAFSPALEVMINDVLVESRLGKLHGDRVSVTVISHRYWPQCRVAAPSHPEFMAETLQVLADGYASQAGSRKIVWQPHLDEVEVELEFENGTFSIACPPEAAMLVSSFDFADADETFNLAMMQAVSGLASKTLVRDAAQFWLRKGVLRVAPGGEDHSFVFARHYDPHEAECIDAHLTMFDDQEPFADEEDEMNQETLALQQFWPILANMFRTFGQLSAERIHSTLSMFSKEYKGPLPLLVRFLQHKVREGHLQVSGNKIIVYSVAGK